MTDPMFTHVAAIPRQLRWAAELAPPEVPAADFVLMAGMGGSGMAARVAALTATELPLVVHQSYDLPPWAPRLVSLVIAVSYSGNTEETLSTVEAAAAAGVPVAVVTSGGRLAEHAAAARMPAMIVPGGLQPRAALAYQAGAAMRLLGVATGRDAAAVAELGAAASLVDSLLGDGEGPAAILGRDLAGALLGRIAVVYGGHGVGAVAASRWKAQINENAKSPAFVGEVPELDHNELTGWAAMPEAARRAVGIVMLRDPHGHPRVETRMGLTAETLGNQVDIVGDVIAQGSSVLERFFSLSIVGDVASVRLAELTGVDATPVPTLEVFKKRLAEARDHEG